MAYLRKLGYQVNHKRVERLMRKLGFRAVYPARKTTKTDTKFKPENLLKNFRVGKADDVWFFKTEIVFFL